MIVAPHAYFVLYRAVDGQSVRISTESGEQSDGLLKEFHNKKNRLATGQGLEPTISFTACGVAHCIDVRDFNVVSSLPVEVQIQQIIWEEEIHEMIQAQVEKARVARAEQRRAAKQ